MRRDDFTTTPTDAAHVEQIRGAAYDDDARPTAAEIVRDMAGLRDGCEHECSANCLYCAWMEVAS